MTKNIFRVDWCKFQFSKLTSGRLIPTNPPSNYPLLFRGFFWWSSDKMLTIFFAPHLTSTRFFSIFSRYSAPPHPFWANSFPDISQNTNVFWGLRTQIYKLLFISLTSSQKLAIFRLYGDFVEFLILTRSQYGKSFGKNFVRFYIISLYWRMMERGYSYFASLHWSLSTFFF